MEEQAPGPAAEPEGRNRIWSSVSHVLSHPLFLLATGAVISAIVVPMFTNRWQDHQHALDVQTQIAADVATRRAQITAPAREPAPGRAPRASGRRG